jgi:hypothetical protein
LSMLEIKGGRSSDGNFLILDFISHPNFEQSHPKNMGV